MAVANILIVEDEVVIAMSIKSMLEKKGYTVSDIISSGAGAVDFVDNQEAPDLIIMDYKLDDDVDGFTAANMITSRHSVPIIFSTAFSDEATLQQAKQARAYGYIVKPVNPNELFSTIEIALYKHSMETQLRESEERFRATFEQAAVGMALLALDGHFIKINQRLCDMLGYREPELLAKTFQEITHPDDLAKDLTQAQLMVDGVIETYSMEKRFICNDRSMVWTSLTVSMLKDLKGVRKHYIAVVEDIGYRMKAEESLRDSEARFRAIGDSVHDGIIIVNGKREISYWNPAAEKMFGYTMAEAYGKKFSDLPVIGGDVEHRGLAYYLDPAIDAGLLQPIALTALRRDGAPFFLELTVSFMHVKNEPHCIGSMRDVTERIEMEKRMAEAEEIERERIGQDLHDGLGQHLTGIRYLCGLLIMRLEKEASPLAGQAREVLKLIDEAKDITRNISRGFGMINLERNGFPLAVKNMLLEAEKMFDISCDFTYDSFNLDTSAASNLYFIIKEAVTNAIRHAHAKKIGVSISSDANKLRVVVTNDGKEYDGINERQPGLGLKIMNYRLLKINGIMDIRKLEDGGTSLSIIVENQHSSQSGV